MIKFVRILVFVVALLPVLNCESLDLLSQWNNFKTKHAKSYEQKEEIYRFQVFQDNLRIIEDHNARYKAGLETYSMGINQFADISNEEWRTFHSSITLPDPEERSNVRSTKNMKTPPASRDWRLNNKVTPVKNQGDCGSCYAFASLAALESHIAIKKNSIMDFSEQMIVDCTRPQGNLGCVGGNIFRVYNFLKIEGCMAETDYPYTATDGPCKYDVKKITYRLKGYIWVNQTRYDLKEAVGNEGPVGVSIDNKEFQFYGGGIFDPAEPFNKTSHAVLIIGYGRAYGIDFWIVKNSYGTDWGENGYARIKMYSSYLLGIEGQALYPDLY